MTWTLFAADGTGYIYEAYSRDYGETFSSPEARQHRQRAVREHARRRRRRRARCNTNQFSQPFTGPDGALYVVWDNYNLTGVRPGEGDEGGGDGGGANAAPPVGDRQPRPGAARQVDRRRQHVLGAGEGRRLLRPARLRDLPGRGPGRAPACPEKGETHELDLPRRQLPVGGRQPARPARDRRDLRLLHQPPLERASNGCVPQGYNPDTFQPLYTGVKTAGRVQQRHPDQPLDQRRRSRSPAASTDVRELPAGARRRRARRPVLAVGGVRPAGAGSPSRTTTAPTATTRRPASRTSACPGRRNGSDFGTKRVTTSSMPPATQFEGAFFGDYSGAERRRRGAPGLDGHARSGPVRLPRLGRQRDPAAERLHRGGSQRGAWPTTRTSTRTR